MTLTLTLTLALTLAVTLTLTLALAFTFTLLTLLSLGLVLRLVERLELLKHPLRDRQCIGAGFALRYTALGLSENGLQPLRQRNSLGEPSRVDRQHKRILAGVRPVGNGSHSLIDHAIDQLGQQSGDVASQLGGNTLLLYPCVLDRIVQLV